MSPKPGLPADMARIGVLGGSFDPVHRGHLHIALLAAESASLDAVLFVPAACPPHKAANSLAPEADRLAMLERALETEPGAAVSRVELEPGGPRFTVDTLDAIQTRRPGDDLRFILGWDSLRDLPTWKDPGGILDRHGIIAVDRPGVTDAVPESGLTSRCRLVRGNPLAISSTQIRDRAARDLPIRHLVPDRVAEYIESRGLYRPHS